jgi:hypothetical protein
MNQHIAIREQQQVFPIKLEEEDVEESRWIESLKEQRRREKELAERERQREQQQQEQPKQKTN